MRLRIRARVLPPLPRLPQRPPAMNMDARNDLPSHARKIYLQNDVRDSQHRLVTCPCGVFKVPPSALRHCPQLLSSTCPHQDFRAVKLKYSVLRLQTRTLNARRATAPQYRHWLAPRLAARLTPLKWRPQLTTSPPSPQLLPSIPTAWAPSPSLHASRYHPLPAASRRHIRCPHTGPHIRS